jgi:hypothetical protein
MSGAHLSSVHRACIRSNPNTFVAFEVECASCSVTDSAVRVLEEPKEEGVAVVDESAGSPPEGIRASHY